MICALVNHSYVHEIQTITQIFFPNTRFTFLYTPNVSDAGYAVLSRLDGGDCAGEVYKDGERLSSHTFPIDEKQSLSVKRALMLALFHALKASVEAYTPWGALTGIRPSKLVRQWLAEGVTDEAVVKRLTSVFQCHEDKALLALSVAHAENRVADAIASLGEKSFLIPLGLYISIPFCPSRCLYCSFTASTGSVSHDRFVRYLDALAFECLNKAQQLREMGGLLSSVYIGGGTPTVLPESLFDRLLDCVADCFGSFMTKAEYTVEAGRPDSITDGKLRAMKDHGVTRIAINPQTLNDRTLTLIGRSHTSHDFFQAFEKARKAGFDRINTDIIAGLPGETAGDMLYTMNGLTALAPENITVHTLAVKRASRLNEHLSEFPFPGTAETEAMLDIARNACDSVGLAPYYLYRQKNMVGLFENVGYSRPGFECLYNIGMMAEVQTILAVGAGAVEKRVDGQRIDRSFNVKNPDIYCERMMKTVE